MIPKSKVREISVSYKPSRRSINPPISSSADAALYLMDGFDPNTIALQEQFVSFI